MGFDGGHRAAAKQISGIVESILIGPTTGSTAGVYASVVYAAVGAEWGEIEVVSSRAVFAGITASGLANSSKITSGTSFLQNAKITCNGISYLKLSSKTTDHMVIARRKVLL